MRATREIKIIVEGVEHTVLIYSYLTGFEKQEMTRIMASGSVMGNGTPEINGEAVMKGQDYLIRTMISSLDGNTENVYDRLMALQSEVYDEVVAEINKTMSDWGKKKVA